MVRAGWVSPTTGTQPVLTTMRTERGIAPGEKSKALLRRTGVTFSLSEQTLSQNQGGSPRGELNCVRC